MPPTGKEIIAAVLKSYPQKHVMAISNCTDLDIQARQQEFYQYIIGVTASDQIGIDINQYRHRMSGMLKRTVNEFKCLPWSYNEDQLIEMKIALQEVSDYFEAGADVERMMQAAMRPQSNPCIVVTIVPVQLLYAG